MAIMSADRDFEALVAGQFAPSRLEPEQWDAWVDLDISNDFKGLNPVSMLGSMAIEVSVDKIAARKAWADARYNGSVEDLGLASRTFALADKRYDLLWGVNYSIWRSFMFRRGEDATRDTYPVVVQRACQTGRRKVMENHRLSPEHRQTLFGFADFLDVVYLEERDLHFEDLPKLG